MPSWGIHEKWARKMGLSVEVLSWVNRFVDDSKHHDIGRGKSKAMRDIVKNIAKMYGGEEAVLALELHHVLDYICSKLNPKRIAMEEVFTIIAHETRGWPLHQRMELTGEIMREVKGKTPAVERVPRSMVINDLIKFMERQEVSDKVKDFVIKNIHEILEELSAYCKG